MASTYTGLGTELMTTGENAGVWGSTTNTNLQIVEQMAGGYIEKAVTSTPTTLAVSDGSTGAELSHRVIKFTGTISEATTVTVPLDVQQMYILMNGTSGAYTLTFKYVTGSGSTVAWTSTDKGTKLVYATADDSTDPNMVDTGISSNLIAGAATSDIILDSPADIIIDAAGGNIEFKDAGTTQLLLDMDTTANEQIIQLKVDSDDLVFKQYDGNEVIRVADDRRLYFYDKGGEYIYGDGTDLHIVSGADVNLSADIGLTFGDDGEKIEGDGTDLTILSSGVLNLAAGGTTNQIKVTDGAILPITDDDVDLGSASYQFKNVYIDGTLETDAITLGGVSFIKIEGTNFTDSLLIGHTTTGTLSTSSSNTGVGIDTLNALTSGDSNTAVGFDAGGAITAGLTNTCIGSAAGKTLTGGDANTLIGQQAGKVLTGNYNTLIGNECGEALTSGDGNVLIGQGIEAASNTGDQQLKIAGNNDSSTVNWIVGDSSGNLTFAGNLSSSSGTSTNPIVALTNTNTDANGSILRFIKDAGEAGAANDISGLISFYADDAGQNNQEFGRITGRVVDATAGGEEGALDFYVAEYDGTVTKGMEIKGLASDGNITVDISTHDGSAGGLMLAGTLVTATAAEINTAAAGVIPGKVEGTDFTDSLLVGHSTTGTLSAAEDNVGVGIDALDAITSGDNNTAVGSSAGSAQTAGGGCTYIGSQAGMLSIGSNNTAVGYRAYDAENNTSSYWNTAVGKDSLSSAGAGGLAAQGNTAIGLNSGGAITSGDYNTCLGFTAGLNLTTGSGNILIGDADATAVDSARTLKIVSYDGTTTTTHLSGDSSGILSIGGNAASQAILKFYEDSDNGSNYIAIQSPAASVAGADYTLTLPELTGDLIPGKLGGTDFTDSILIGHATTGTLSAAVNNVGIGGDSGSYSLSAVTSGDNNFGALGALDALTTGSNNIAIGDTAMTYIVIGTNNVALGPAAMKQTRSGDGNIGIGSNALRDVNSTDYSVGIGNEAGKLTTGTRNTYLGAYAGDNITSGAGNVIIGGVDAASATGDRQLMITGYDGSTTTTWISGESTGNTEVAVNWNPSLTTTGKALVMGF